MPNIQLHGGGNDIRYWIVDRIIEIRFLIQRLAVRIQIDARDADKNNAGLPKNNGDF